MTTNTKHRSATCSPGCLWICYKYYDADNHGYKA